MTLRELLAHRRTTQSQVAAALGVTQAMVSKWVRGERKPKLETAHRLADALHAEPVPPETPGGKWTYRPVEDSPAQKDGAGKGEYLDDAE